MRKIFTLVLIIASLCFIKPSAINAQVNVQDSLALVDLYNSSNGAHWYNNMNWLTSEPVSRWFGVLVSSNRVSSLYLDGNQLTGPIPASIGSLTELKTLVLASNKLSGVIPTSISKLSKVYYLNLSGNYLSGGISFLGKLPGLETIELRANQLSGKIPTLNNPNLLVLDLELNQLSGSIPTFGKDTATTISLFLDNNKLTGSINHQFDSLLHLNKLALGNNQLTGRIPASLNKLVNLTIVDLSNNNLSGKIPSLDSLKDITYLGIGSNQLTFNGMEDLVSHFPNAVYSPQANINIQQNGNVLSVAAGGTISNNTYNWYKDGVLFKTKKGNKNLTVNGKGNYSVTVTNSIAAELTLYSDTVRYTNLTATNISELNNQHFPTITTYPNPANKIVTITFKATGKYSITVNDFSGKVLQVKNGIASKEINSIQLDVSNYANGVYFLTVKDEMNNSQTIKLTKE